MTAVSDIRRVGAIPHESQCCALLVEVDGVAECCIACDSHAEVHHCHGSCCDGHCSSKLGSLLHRGDVSVGQSHAQWCRHRCSLNSSKALSMLQICKNDMTVNATHRSAMLVVVSFLLLMPCACCGHTCAATHSSAPLRLRLGDRQGSCTWDSKPMKVWNVSLTSSS